MLSNIQIVNMSSEYAGLAWKFQVNPESCDNCLHYTNYIRLIAINDNMRGMGTTFIIVGCESDTFDEQAIAGYVTLKAATLIKDVVEGQRIGEPALEISELAVNELYENQGIGSLLVQFALTKATELNKRFLGIKHVVLCADPAAVDFYKKLDFVELEAYSELPRERWNRNCTPMYITLPETLD